MKHTTIFALSFVFLFGCDDSESSVEDLDNMKNGITSHCVRYVDKDSNAQQDGLSWESAFSDIEQGIKAATDSATKETNCEVWVKGDIETYLDRTDEQINIGRREPIDEEDEQLNLQDVQNSHAVINVDIYDKFEGSEHSRFQLKERSFEGEAMESDIAQTKHALNNCTPYTYKNYINPIYRNSGRYFTKCDLYLYRTIYPDCSSRSYPVERNCQTSFLR